MAKGKIIGFLLLIVLIIAIAIVVFHSEPVKSSNHVTKAQMEFVTQEVNAIESSSSIPIKKVAVFGTGSNITTAICFDEWGGFSVQKSSYLYVLSNGFYVPTYEVVQENYYKSNSTSLGDYVPSLIGQKVYLSFIDVINKTYSENTSAPYIVKSENINGDEVSWNLTFNGNTSNAISPNNATELSKTISWLNGVIFQNGTGLISPRNPYIKVNGNVFIPNNC